MAEGLCIQNGILEAYTERGETAVIPEGVHTIGENAFKGCTSLERIILPSTLRSIGFKAFKGCRHLREVEIPEGVSHIGEYAFHRCHALERISVPASVTELGDCVFLYCDSLREARIPGVRRLGRQVFLNDVRLERIMVSRELREDCLYDVFTGCGRISRIDFPDGESIPVPTAVEAACGDAEVPSLVRAIAADIVRMMKLDGRRLTEFLTNLKHVEIPEGIEEIGKSCFFDKRGIMSISLPRSLREIDDRAFRNCISLEKVIFAGEGACIHEDAFKNCSSLRHIETCGGKVWELSGIAGSEGEDIPETVRTIRRQVLGNFRISGTMLLKYLGEESRVVVPDGITMIGERAFAGNEAVDRVILPGSVREIGAEAFKDCLLLQNIALPECVRRIGANAFENCVKLIRVFWPEGAAEIEAGVFKRCRALREVHLAPSLRRIGEQAFYGCPALIKVQFPAGLLSIEAMAFFRCKGLKEVILPEALERLGSLAFGQSGVRKAVVPAGGRDFGSDVFAGCTGLRSLIFGERVRHISDRFAYGCSALCHVTVPEGLESAGKNVWEKTPYLERWKEKVREAPEKAGSILWDAGHLEGEVCVGGSVRILAGGAFYHNKKVTSVRLPGNVRWVGAAAFKGCCALVRVEWACGMDRLEAEVFSGCVRLERVDKIDRAGGGPEGTWESIGERAFYRCGRLRRLCLGRTVRIGKEAFAGCVSLERSPAADIFPRTGKDPAGDRPEQRLLIGERAFEDSPFPERRTDGLALVGSVIVSGASCAGELHIPEGVTAIAPYAFAGNGKVTKAVFPDSLAEIGEGAFWGCGGLEEVLFQGGVRAVGARAFEKCDSLLRVSADAEQVGAGAFSWCGSLEYACLTQVRILEAGVFEGCRALKECVCERAEEVKDRCFCGCGELTRFDLRKIHRVGRYAFGGCDSLIQAALRDGAVLEAHAFEDCGALEEIVLTGEKGGICLREYALSGCTSLRLVRRREKEYRFHCYRDILSSALPETVRLLFHSALSCFEVEREENLCGYLGKGRIVKIPEGIRRIEAEVFRDKLMLKEIHIPESVEYIGARAFHGTAWMRERQRESPLVTVDRMLLDGSGCEGEVIVPGHIRLVCGWAFANGMKIRKIRFTSGQVRVEEYAFRNCIYLEEIGLPDGARIRMGGIKDREKELPALAKQAVTERLNCFKTDEKGVLLECTGNLYHILLPEGITAIGEAALRDSNLLTDIVFPETVKEIGRSAFSGCKWLKEVRQAYGVEKIGAMAFSGCGALERAELSQRLHEIGARAFEHCTALREICIPDGVEEIPDKAFYRCHSLRRIELPPTVKKIGKEAFAFCRELEEIRIPEGAAVMERAFAGCGRMSEVTAYEVP